MTYAYSAETLPATEVSYQQHGG